MVIDMDRAAKKTDKTVWYLERYIDETGSTWYKPDTYNIKQFDEAADKGLIIKEGCLYTLPKIAAYEKDIARYVTARLHYDEDLFRHYPESFLDMYISLYEKREGIILDDRQKEAVYLAFKSNIFILTGGPGTGKTSVLKCIYYCLKNILKTDDICFMAPTGRAARRITESVGTEAFTVAKKFGLYGEEKKPKQLNCEAAIVDEASMLDTYSAHVLFTATKLGAKIILVGDVDQLPSVGYGAVLRDLLDSGIPCVKLEKTFRQASESGLFANIAEIKTGLKSGFIIRDDFSVLNVSDCSDAKDLMISQFMDAVKIHGIDQVTCLTPYRRKGNCCAIGLNRMLQERLNPVCRGKNTVRYTAREKDGFSYDIRLNEGDPVMQLVNRDVIANGDIGIVRKIDTSKKLIYVRFTDCEVVYNRHELAQLTLAYAMSVHKSQGSEYTCVITSAISEDINMLSRNILYTAVTRAKKECRVITDGDTATIACKRKTGYERTTRLASAIRNEEKILQLLFRYNAG